MVPTKKLGYVKTCNALILPLTFLVKVFLGFLRLEIKHQILVSLYGRLCITNLSRIILYCIEQTCVRKGRDLRW